MSEVQSVRVRSQRSAAAAVERARLTVVANRPSSARRAPFAVLVFLILGAGVVGLLMFNTHMQQASIYATHLQAKADRLQAKSEALAREQDQLRSPQSLAELAAGIGMVVPPNPATVNLETGKVDGDPVPATTENRPRIRPNLTPVPPNVNRKPIIHKVIGAASTTAGTPARTNKTPDKPTKGAPR